MNESESSSTTENSPLINKINQPGRKTSKSLPKEISRKYLKKSNNDRNNANRSPYMINSDQILNRSASTEDLRDVAQYKRYRYYSKLHGSMSEPLVIPAHVLPRSFFFFKGDSGAKQSSIITIFAIWNTMMGTSLLSMPWALQQSGFMLGLLLMAMMMCICLYTCLIILKSEKTLGLKTSVEFVDVCQHYLGAPAKYVAFTFGVVAFLGAIIVYWVLMSNFLYKVGKFTHDHTVITPDNIPKAHFNYSTIYHNARVVGEKRFPEVICHKHSNMNQTSPDITPSADNSFYNYWDQRKTVPLYLIVVLLPLSSLKSPTFFTKFNALGTVSVLYILVFVIVRAVQWGPHLHFNVPLAEGPTKLYNFGFPALTGILALALYIHNAILSILATNEKPENNTRDVTVAYILTTGTYAFVAVLFYSFFPLDKSCIEQVFLDNFVSSDIMTFVAQCGLLFQMTTVFPLLMYIVRIQILGFFLNRSDYSYLSIIIHNIVLISAGVLMAIFYPNVGHIIRYVGSVSGMVYIFTLPSLVKMVIQYKDQSLKPTSILIHGALIGLGLANFIAQFLVAE
ncbi:neutral amino acid transporter 9-like [Clytia hemisphaerica]|uniref:Amino acid transporter transmembrane domain-containing protein n=1 Tax=Clytia hemisphaerica TaxID=252671 RepID=A0A7M5V172_9CNID|eukprot:TCONS_00052924-protein